MQIIRYIIILTPFFITAFWGLVFLLNPVRKNRARFGLGIFMLITSIVYFSHAVFFAGDYMMYMKIDWIYAFAALSVYPLYYLYIRLLTRDVNFKWRYLWHLLPAFLVAGLLQFFITHATPADKATYLNKMLIHRDWSESGGDSFIMMITVTYLASRVIFGIQAIVYTIVGLNLIKKYNRRVANFYSNLTGKKMVWLELLTITFIFTAAASIILNILGRSFFIHNHALLIPSVLFSALFFTIGLLGNKQNYTISDLVLEENEPEESQEKPGNHPLLKENLILLMKNEQLFLDPNLRITTLAQKLGTNRTYLSHLINEEYGMSFSDFVNQYRVEYAKQLMDSDYERNYSMNYFAEKSGFGSVSSFIRAFKQFEKITAGKYHQSTVKKAS